MGRFLRRLNDGSHGFESHLMVLLSRCWLLTSGEGKAREPGTAMQDMVATALEYEEYVSWKIFNQVNI